MTSSQTGHGSGLRPADKPQGAREVLAGLGQLASLVARKLTPIRHFPHRRVTDRVHGNHVSSFQGPRRSWKWARRRDQKAALQRGGSNGR